jgi:hypothetical protein
MLLEFWFVPRRRRNLPSAAKSGFAGIVIIEQQMEM